MSVRGTYIGICVFVIVLIELSSCGPIYTRYVRKRLSSRDKQTYVVEVKEVFHTVNHPPLFGSSEDDIDRFLKYDLKYRGNNLGTEITHHNSQVPIAPTISIIEHDTFDNNGNNYDYQNGYDGFGNGQNGFDNRNSHTTRPTSAPATTTTTSRSLFSLWGSSKSSGTTVPTTTARITTVPTKTTAATTVPTTTARTTTTTTTEQTTTEFTWNDYYDNEGETTAKNDPDFDSNDNNDLSTETEDEYDRDPDEYDRDEDETDGPTQEPTTTTTTTTEAVIETTTKRKFVDDFFPMKATTPTSAPTTKRWSWLG